MSETGRGRRVVGMIGAVLCVLSGAMHSIMGWPALNAEFVKTNAPVALVKGLAVPWHFAGLAMVTFGIIALDALWRAGRDATVSLRPVHIIGIVYTLFGYVGLVLHKFDITFLLFAVPGMLMLFGSTGRR